MIRWKVAAFMVDKKKEVPVRWETKVGPFEISVAQREDGGWCMAVYPDLLENNPLAISAKNKKDAEKQALDKVEKILAGALQEMRTTKPRKKRGKNKAQYYTVAISTNENQSVKNIVNNRELVCGELRYTDPKSVINLLRGHGYRAFTIRTTLSKKDIENTDGVAQVVEGADTLKD